MSNGVEIRYGDIAPEAKENFIPSASESKFDTLSQLKRHNLNFPNYANPCELYSVVLDGGASAFPSNPDTSNLGLWSEQISGDDGAFAEPIVLTLISAGQYSSQGFTFTFDTHNGIYATRIGIKWIRSTDEEIILIDEKEFTPDSAFYFCQNKVDNYNKIVITFYSINMPQNRLKLRAIDYGYGTTFYGDELRNVKLIQEINPISTEISINTADFTIDSKSDIQYSFQVKQPLSIYFNGELKATTFVKSSKRKSKNIWDIQSEDYIGLLDTTQYYGGMYTNAKAVDIISDIFSVAKVPYIIDEIFADITVTGYIPFTTCRNALMQVAFAIQAVVDTSNSDVIKVFALEDEIKQTIPLERIMQGQNFSDEETVTGVEIASHSYKPISDTVDVYDATESGMGGNIFIKFSEPLHDLSIVNGEIVSQGTNYIVINANDGCLVTGKKYEHTTSTKRKNNPLVLASDIEKVIAIDSATLVSNNNIDNLLGRCYNWLIRNNSTSLKIVEGKHTSYGDKVKYGQKKYGTFKYGEGTDTVVTYDKRVYMGDNIKVETEYLGTIEGRVVKQSFNLNGSIIIKQCEVVNANGT